MREILKIVAIGVLLVAAPAFARGGHYGGGYHTASHGGMYSGGSGSSHRGGHYVHPSTGNHYGCHKC